MTGRSSPTSTVRPHVIAATDVDDLLSDIDALAEAVWLCAEGAEHVALGANSRPFVALQQAFEDRINAFRRAHGMLDEPVAGEPT